VLGEVKSPGAYPVTNERISIVEAIGLAGDLTIQGKRTEVTLIREQQGERKIVTLDLTSKALFNSPYFYLAQNDVIYVAPNKSKINSSGVGTNTSVILSSISTLISLIAIITR
jgi:polysaccharide export outer membrane protein